MGVIARVPLDEDSLGGKMTLQTTFPKGDWRAGYFGPKNLAKTIERVDKLKEIVPTGMTLPEMAVAIYSVASSGGHDDRRDEKSRTCAENIAASDAGPLDKSLLAELKKRGTGRRRSGRTKVGPQDGRLVVRVYSGHYGSQGSPLHF